MFSLFGLSETETISESAIIYNSSASNFFESQNIQCNISTSFQKIAEKHSAAADCCFIVFVEIQVIKFQRTAGCRSSSLSQLHACSRARLNASRAVYAFTHKYQLKHRICFRILILLHTWTIFNGNILHYLSFFVI